MYKKAVELAEANGWFLARQFETEANADIHETTTAREIIADFTGERLDYFVTGYGTGGTVTGVGRVLRKERPETKIILCEPANAQLLGSGKAQERTADGAPAASHPAFEPHPIQGWTPDFIPLRAAGGDRQALLRRADPDRRRRGHEVGAASWRRRKASSPASPAARPSRSRMQVAEKAEPGSVILCMLPDTGERYLSTPLFEGDSRGHERGGTRAVEIDAWLSTGVGPEGPLRPSSAAPSL